MSISAICINNKNKPKEIAEKFWIKKGQQYTIEYIYRSLNPNSFDELMVELKEVKMDNSCLPYQYYSLKRFAIDINSLEEFMMLCKTTAQFNDLEVTKLVEEFLTVEQ